MADDLADLREEFALELARQNPRRALGKAFSHYINPAVTPAEREALLDFIDLELARVGIPPEDYWRWKVSRTPFGDYVLEPSDEYMKTIHRPLPAARVYHRTWWRRLWYWIAQTIRPRRAQCQMYQLAPPALRCPQCGQIIPPEACMVCHCDDELFGYH